MSASCSPFAAAQDVLFVVGAVFREPDGCQGPGTDRGGGRIELAMPGGTITDEAYELAIVRALRPLAGQRRTVRVRPVRELATVR